VAAMHAAMDYVHRSMLQKLLAIHRVKKRSLS